MNQIYSSNNWEEKKSLILSLLTLMYNEYACMVYIEGLFRVNIASTYLYVWTPIGKPLSIMSY